jgi:histidinol-phosphate aminotransferase
MTARQRPTVARIPSYRAGQRAAPGGHKLSSNENPHAPLPSVLEAVMRAAGDMNRYPDPHSTDLVTALAERLGVAPEQVVVGCGSVAVCEQVVSCVAGHGDEVIFGWPSFEAYPIITGVAGATAVPIPLRSGWRQDLDAAADAVTASTRCIFVCTPNNPTATIVTTDEVRRLLDRVPSDLLVVIDEAYAEFVDDPAAVDGLAMMQDYPNVAVLRTFSKAYGLAGLRVGYAVAQPELADGLRKTAIPFGVSVVAHDAALASLAAEDELLARVEWIRAERNRVSDALRAAGWELPDAQGNFLWLPTGDDTTQVHTRLMAAGIVTRPFPGVGIRVSVAERDANDALIEVLTQS